MSQLHAQTQQGAAGQPDLTLITIPVHYMCMRYSTAIKIGLISYIAAMALCLASMRGAHAWELIEMQDVYVNYKQFLPGGRDPLITGNGIPGQLMDRELNLHMDMDVLRVGYWHNMVHSMTAKDKDGGGQFRVVGWNTQVGVHLCTYLDVQYEHYSQHMLDGTLPNGFPVQDSVGIVLHLYRGPASVGH